LRSAYIDISRCCRLADLQSDDRLVSIFHVNARLSSSVAVQVVTAGVNASQVGSAGVNAQGRDVPFRTPLHRTQSAFFPGKNHNCTKFHPPLPLSREYALKFTAAAGLVRATPADDVTVETYYCDTATHTTPQ